MLHLYSALSLSNQFTIKICRPRITLNLPRTLQIAGIRSISGSQVNLTNNVTLQPKMLVCATGWTLDLDCLPSDRAMQSFDTVQSRLFCRFWDIDYPGLAFVSLSNGFMCAPENANLVSQAVAQVLLGKWTQPSMEYMVPSSAESVLILA